MNTFELFEISAKLLRLKALASCLEDKLHEAAITMDEKGENVFCLVDLLQENIDALIDGAGKQKEGVA